MSGSLLYQADLKYEGELPLRMVAAPSCDFETQYDDVAEDEIIDITQLPRELGRLIVTYHIFIKALPFHHAAKTISPPRGYIVTRPGDYNIGAACLTLMEVFMCLQHRAKKACVQSKKNQM